MAAPAVTPQQLGELLDLEALKAERAERHLRHFVKQAWNTVEPATTYQHNWHIDALCDHLEATLTGDIRNLVITMPPRAMKSYCISVFFPAWAWIRRPELRFLYASYAQTLATQHSMASRRVIESDWYQARWGRSFSLADDDNLKTRFSNNKRGERIATSVGAAVTGLGGDYVLCLGGNVPLCTNKGSIPIGEIVENQLPVRVLAYNHATNQPVWRDIEAYEKNVGRPFVRATFSHGKSIECTEDHPVYVASRGYVPAGALTSGDEVLVREVHLQSVRQRVQPIAETCSAEKERAVLLSHVLGAHGAREEQSVMGRGLGNAVLQDMRSTVHGETGQGNEGKVLLNNVLRGTGSKTSIEATDKNSNRLRLLREDVRAGARGHEEDEVLFSSVRERLSFHSNHRTRERSLGARTGERALRLSVSEDSSNDSRARRSNVSPLPQDAITEWEETRCSSHRLRQRQQRSDEPDQSLSTVPFEDTWPVVARTPRMDRAFVESVESIDTPEHTYNVRVAEHHNYFASDVLVHNCDDPHLVTEAESDAVRESVLTWWNQSMSTRLNDPATGVKIIVMQRVHERDLAGIAIESGDYVHLNLPLEYEPTPFVSPLGWTDPRTDPGELLWPERMGPDFVAQQKRTLGSRAFASQYQQRPSPAEGGTFKRHWWRYWQPRGANLPPVAVRQPNGETRHVPAVEQPAWWERSAQSWDLTFKQTESGSYVVGLVGATHGPNLYLRDCYRDRVDFPGTIAAIQRVAGDHPDVDAKLIEEKANGAAVIATLRDAIGGLIPVQVAGGKEARAHASTPHVEGGNVFLPHPAIASWVDAFIDELAAFPHGAFSDQVDAFSQLERHLLGGGGNLLREPTGALADYLSIWGG